MTDHDHELLIRILAEIRAVRELLERDRPRPPYVTAIPRERLRPGAPVQRTVKSRRPSPAKGCQWCQW